jgi:hypothetical protein
MIKLTRRTLAGVTAVAAMAVGIGAQAATPPVADAAPACSQWRLPAQFSIYQGNGWQLWTARRSTAGFTRDVYAAPPGASIATMYGTMKFSRFDVSGINAQVRFTISWTNGSAGVYTGTIDDDGFLTGTTRDRFNPTSTARFHFLETMNCA